MQKVECGIEAGSRLVFCRYIDEESIPLDGRLFQPGQFLVVGAINDEDGGMQCFPTDETGKVISREGDTLFDEEVIHLAYAPRLDVRSLGAIEG